MLSEWLQRALEESQITQAALARELTRKVGRSVDRAAVNKMLTNERKIAGDELLAIEEITGYDAPDEIEVPFVGKVGAGQAVYAMDSGDNQTAPAPRHVRPSTVAVLVQGDSMFPLFEDGTILYYSRLLPPREMVNRRCVVQLGDGRIYVKVLRLGTTDITWTLQSVNSQFPDMVDEVVEWAAPIDWIKPRY